MNKQKETAVNPIIKTAPGFRDLFELRKVTRTPEEQEEGKQIYCFKHGVINNNNPDYSIISDVMRDLQLEDDFKYEQVVNCLDWIIEQDENITLDELQDKIHEQVDGSVDVYTSDLTSWLASSNYHPYYLDEAVKIYGASDNILALAQYMAIEEVYNAIVSLVKQTAEGNEGRRL